MVTRAYHNTNSGVRPGLTSINKFFAKLAISPKTMAFRANSHPTKRLRHKAAALFIPFPFAFI